MLRKIIAPSLLALLIPKFAFAGLYTGVSAGYLDGSWEVTDAANNNVNFGGSGPNVGLFAGFGDNVNENFYLALEAFGSADFAKSSRENVVTTYGTTSAKLKKRYSYGASFLPGVSFGEQCNIVYLRMGVLWSRFDTEINSLPGQTTSSTSLNSTAGGQGGIGVQLGNKTVAVRVEIDRNIYRTFRTYGLKVNPKDNQLAVGLLYKFD